MFKGMRRILNLDGTVNKDLEPHVPKEELLKIYEVMIAVRALDERAMRLQRQGRIFFAVPTTGQEAHVGAAAALKEEDWIVPAYREPGCAIYRGLPLADIVNHLFANDLDPQKGRRLQMLFGNSNIRYVTPSPPIGTQIIHAAGIGYAANYLKDRNVALVFFGDGATSSNDFHSGMNFAGVFKTPTIFMCQNNQYAISVPVSQQTAAKELIDKAIGYGMESIAVDGNDVLAVFTAVKEAAERGRNGEGPTFIESRTYRQGAHTSSDDPTRYRSKDEVDKWLQLDPITRFNEYLQGKSILTDVEDKEIRTKYQEEIGRLIKEAEGRPKPEIDTIFTDVYTEIPWHLQEQLEYARKFLESG